MPNFSNYVSPSRFICIPPTSQAYDFNGNPRHRVFSSLKFLFKSLKDTFEHIQNTTEEKTKYSNFSDRFSLHWFEMKYASAPLLQLVDTSCESLLIIQFSLHHFFPPSVFFWPKEPSDSPYTVSHRFL